MERERIRQVAAQGKYRKGATLLLRTTGQGVHTNPREVVQEKVGDLSFRFLAGEFFQSHPFILPSFVEHVANEAAG